MPLVVECPSCGKKLKVPDNLVGKQVRCADCAGTFNAENRSVAPPPAPSRAPATRDRDDYDDDRPERRSRRRDYGNYAPDRGGMILAFGIISLVSGLIGGLFFIGLPLGIMAWVWGGRDMKEIAAGRMNPGGQSNTQIGYILGIIGTILNLIILLVGCAVLVIYLVFVVAIFGLFAGAAAGISTAPMTPPPPAPRKPGKFMIQAGAMPLRVVDYLPGRPRP